MIVQQEKGAMQRAIIPYPLVDLHLIHMKGTDLLNPTLPTENIQPESLFPLNYDDIHCMAWITLYIPCTMTASC